MNDLLEKKIEEAKRKLPEESLRAITSIDWKKILLDYSNKKYNQDQILELETETELLIYNLLDPEDYVKQLEKRMGISAEEVLILVNDLDKLLFQKMKNLLEEILASKEDKDDDIPLPPYAKKDSSTHSEPLPPKGLPVMDGNIKTEEELFEKTGIKMMDENKKENLEENKFTNSEDKILFDSGIKTIEEGHTVDKGNSLSNVNMESISNQINIPIPPEAKTNMINQRLNENVVNTQSTVTHSSDLLAKDPYHETID